MSRLNRSRKTLLGICALAVFGLACSDPHVLVVGLDGANWRAVEPLMDAGLVPNIERLVRDGARADLDCVPAHPYFACYCPPVWTSIATGTDFGTHRIGSLYDRSETRRSKAIWNLAAEHGARVVTSNWRGTWPPEEGVEYVFTEPGLGLAADILFDTWHGGTPHPGRALPDPLFHPPDALEQLDMLPPPLERPTTWAVYAADRVAAESLLRLESRRAREKPWDRRTELTMILVHGPDKVAHMLWGLFQEVMYGPFDEAAYLERARIWDGPVEQPAPLGWGPVAGPYQEVDAWLGELLETGSYDYVVFVSDHGMTRNPKPGVWGHHHATAFEAHRGIFSVTGLGVRKGAWLGTVSVLDVAPTLAYLLDLPVAEDLPGRVLSEAFTEFFLEWKPADGSTVPSWEDAAP